MRVKRRSGIIHYTGWALGLCAGCGLVITGLWQLGVIEISETAGLPKWLSQETAAPTPAVTADSGSKPTPAVPKNSQSESAAPSASPASGVGSSGEQLLVQSANPAAASEGVNAWLAELAKVVLKENELFSLDAWVKSTAEKAKLEMKQDEISQIGGLLYEVALKAGLTIGERHVHKELPAYAQAGFDVEYQSNLKDLTLFNPFSFSMQVGVVAGNQPIVYLKGNKDGKWAPVNLEIVEEPLDSDKVELVDYTLGTGKGETKRQEGKKGNLIQVKAKEADIVRVVAKDYYAPLPDVVARGPTEEESKAR